MRNNGQRAIAREGDKEREKGSTKTLRPNKNFYATIAD